MKNIGIQEGLSLGYVYLLLLGLMTDSIEYAYVGINILNYSTFLDILITPLKHLTSNLILPTTLVGTIVLFYLWNEYVFPKLQKPKENETATTSKQARLIFMLASMIVGLFFGLSIGMGSGLKSKIEAGKMKPDHLITFGNDKKMKVKIIGQNSVYVFYVPENEKEIIISPISDNIFQIKKLPLSIKAKK